MKTRQAPHRLRRSLLAQIDNCEECASARGVRRLRRKEAQLRRFARMIA
jgi:sulfur relay (sulfurtransferase) complex TusBCD TusD component (DsrE family)